MTGGNSSIPLACGDRVGAYQITAQIGSGGMGEVYLGRDTRLGRDIAIKILPPAFSRDAERVARFQREAQLLAAFNHPNIAGIHGLEEHHGAQYLVLEYVPGETLAERIQRGAMPLDEAIAVCKQIAEALEAAHEKGILHRDLKPANIKITPAGKVKVLDFGLAKDVAARATAVSDDSPTLTSPAHITRAGVILGTAAYMSPEQARGKTLDKRTDIWAFGCVLFETLSARQPFTGETVTDLMASIVRSEPDWSALPPGTPARVRWLLKKCLQKEPEQRLRDIGDARLEMEEALHATPEAAPIAAIPNRRLALPWALCGLLAVLAGIALWSASRHGSAPTRTTARAVIPLPPKTSAVLGRGSAVAIAPDGTRVVYVATPAGGAPRLFLRSLDQIESNAIPDTDGATNPFFSPDGQWVGFFADRKLKKVSIAGGAPIVLCDAPNPRGEAWGVQSEILFTPASNSGISRVAAAGGAPKVLTAPESGELSHRWPQVLPGGKAVVFTVWNDTGFDNARIAVQSLDSARHSTLLHGGGYARYAALPDGRGYLVYARTDGLLAAPFDLQRLEVTGAPVPILDGVITNLSGGAHFSFSQDGSLVYMPGVTAEAEGTLVWVDRKGAIQEAGHLQGLSQLFRLSPDGRRIVRNNSSVAGGGSWIYDLERKADIRLASGREAVNGVWTPDGKRIVYTSGMPTGNLYWKAADGSGAEERLTTSSNSQYAFAFTPDGKFLVYTELHPMQGSDIWILSMENGRKTRPFLATPYSEDRPALSPDGKWIAYASNESGRFEIYVQPFPEGGKRYQISTDIGYNPVWSKNGRELFFQKNDQMMVAAIRASSEFQAEKPRPLFTGRFAGYYDVASDGRFLMMVGMEQGSAPTQFNLVLNWFGDLMQRVGKK